MVGWVLLCAALVPPCATPVNVDVEEAVMGIVVGPVPLEPNDAAVETCDPVPKPWIGMVPVVLVETEPDGV